MKLALPNKNNLQKFFGGQNIFSLGLFAQNTVDFIHTLQDGKD